jgi:uncharacterized membrane protein YdfJ with MMPL/SSD domain
MMTSHQLGLPAHQYVYLHSRTLNTGDSGFRTAIAQVSSRMRGVLGGTADVTVARDQRGALVTVTASRPFDAASLRASVASAAAAYPGLSAMVADPTSNTSNDLHRAEQLSIPVTLIVLLIGMAVGVDYALFYVVRSREERLRGVSTSAALERTSRTSGRSVLIAGATVAIAMARQFVVGSDIFNGIAAGTIVVVGCAVAGSVTVLPAILVAAWPAAESSTIRRAVSRLEALAASEAVAHPPFTAGLGHDARSLALGLPLTGFGDNTASRNSVRKLRDVLVSQTLGRIPGVKTAVTGDTAHDIDFTSQMRHGVPYVVGFVLPHTFVLLVVF